MRKGIFSFLGDSLVLEEKPSYTAHWDIFEENYIIRTSEDKVIRLTDEQDFIRDFFAIYRFKLLKADERDIKSYYVRGRIQLNPVKIVKPLRILGLFSSLGGITTQWMKVRLR